MTPATSVFCFLATIAVDSELTFWQNLNYQLVGVAIVIFSLGFLAGAVFAAGKIVQASVKAMHKPMMVPAVTQPMMGLTDKGGAEGGGGGKGEDAVISRELRAVLSAAGYVSLKGAHRIIAINPVTSAQTHAWSMEGRRQIFQSHRVR